jgi:hypothetical protein
MTIFFGCATILALVGIGVWRFSGRWEGWLKVFSRIGALAAILASAFSMFLFLFSSVACQREDYPSVQAPNGRWVAAVSEEDCGALDSFRSAVQIWSVKHTLLNPFASRELGKTIFKIGNDPTMLHLEWVGPNALVIRYPNNSPASDEFLCRSPWNGIHIQCLPYSPDYSKPHGNIPKAKIKRLFYSRF